jgi:hypothetical protein
MDYFSEIKSALIVSPAVKSYSILEEVVKDLEGYLRVMVVLKNNDLLEIFIYVISNKKLKVQKYRFHWQTKEGLLRRRWDNAPHHRRLTTFPHHIHIGDKVLPHEFIEIFQILKIIEQELM